MIRDPAAPDVPVTLAVLQNGQMLRKIGHRPRDDRGCRPTNFTSPIVQTSWPQAVEFVWKPGMTKVYVYDRATGLWRSDDYGFSWTRIYASPDRGTNKQGFVAVDPVNENIVYVSTSAGLSVVTNAGTAGAGRGAPHADPGARWPGRAAGRRGRRPDLRRHPARPGGPRRPDLGQPHHRRGRVGLAWHDLTDDLWDNAINDTRELAVGGNGALYVALSGGVFVLDTPAVPVAPD